MTPAPAGNPPEHGVLPQVFEVRCSDLHPLGCVEVMRSESPETLLALAREHGEHAHGFTTVFYSAERLAVMAQAVNVP